MKYEFYLPNVQLKDGLSHYGSAVRLRNFVSDLTAGTRPLKVGVIGGMYISVVQMFSRIRRYT